MKNFAAEMATVNKLFQKLVIDVEIEFRHDGTGVATDSLVGLAQVTADPIRDAPGYIVTDVAQS